jgi:GDP-4-dehydro-6-deoxy-D-mannose reductase
VGNIRVQRDFSDVRDVVRAYELLLERAEAGAAYNVASGQSVSIAQIIGHLRALCRRKFRVEVQATRLRQGEALRLYGSYRRLRRATGWKPEYAFSQTLKDVYTYWKMSLGSRTAHASS